MLNTGTRIGTPIPRRRRGEGKISAEHKTPPTVHRVLMFGIYLSLTLDRFAV